MLQSLKNKILIRPRSLRGMFFKNFSWLVVGNIGSRLLKALIVIYAARRLGAEGYGIFSYALGLAGFFVFFKNIGIDGILTREVAKKPEKDREYFSTSLAIEIFLVAATFLLIVFAAPFFSGIAAASALLPLAALILVFDDLRDIFVALFRGKEKMELEAFVVIAGSLALVVFGFFVLRLQPTPFYFALANSVASLVSLGLGIFLARSFLASIGRYFSKNLIRPIFTSAWPIAVGGLAGIFLYNIDVIMIGWWRGAAEVGFYSAAQRVVGILAIFSSFVATAIFPTLSRLAESDKNKVAEIFSHSLKVIFIVALPLVAGGLVLREALIGLIFGPSYAAAIPAFAILIFSVLAVHPLAVFINILFAFDQQKKMVKFALIASLANVAINFILIPRIGGAGAAAATLASFVFYAAALGWTSWKICHFRIVDSLAKSAGASLLMGLLVFSFQAAGLPVLINIAVSSIFYFFCLFLMKEKTSGEIWSFLNYGFRNRIKNFK